MDYNNTIEILNIMETLLVTIKEEYWSSFIPIFRRYLKENRLNQENYSAWREAFWDNNGFLAYKVSLTDQISKKELKVANKILENLKYELYRSWVKKINPSFDKNGASSLVDVRETLNKV